MIEQQNRYVTFWIEDLHHNVIEHSCNPNMLNNICINDKPDEPLDITPVYFKREVLSKFYNAPHKYNVSDGLVQYKEEGISLRVDTDMKDYVAVLLVDFAFLDYNEQLYWRSYNIQPDKTMTFSKVAYKRWYEGEYAQSSAPDTILIKRYIEFYSLWENLIGWSLFQEKTEKENSILYSIHMLADENNEKEFDEQILVLTKLFIDSLNVNYFPKLKENNNSLNRFCEYLNQYGINGSNLFEFLRKIQRLRSTKVAHLASVEENVSNYFGIGQKTYGYIINCIFATFVQVIATLSQFAYMIKEKNNHN